MVVLKIKSNSFIGSH